MGVFQTVVTVASGLGVMFESGILSRKKGMVDTIFEKTKDLFITFHHNLGLFEYKVL